MAAIRKEIIEAIEEKVGSRGFKWDNKLNAFWRTTDFGGHEIALGFKTRKLSGFDCVIGVRFDLVESIAQDPYFAFLDSHILKHRPTINTGLGRLSAYQQYLMWDVDENGDVASQISPFIKLLLNQGENFLNKFSDMNYLYKYLKPQRLGYQASIKEPACMARTVVALAYFMQDYKEMGKLVARYNEELPPLVKTILSESSLADYHDFVSKITEKEDYLQWKKTKGNRKGLFGLFATG